MILLHWTLKRHHGNPTDVVFWWLSFNWDKVPDFLLCYTATALPHFFPGSLLSSSSPQMHAGLWCQIGLFVHLGWEQISSKKLLVSVLYWKRKKSSNSHAAELETLNITNSHFIVQGVSSQAGQSLRNKPTPDRPSTVSQAIHDFYFIVYALK